LPPALLHPLGNDFSLSLSLKQAMPCLSSDLTPADRWVSGGVSGAVACLVDLPL
jgi:hypothetical protein